MARLEKEGIFKAIPFSWDVRHTVSGSVSINFGFIIQSELNHATGDFDSWEEYGVYRTWGDWWVIKKDGKPNVAAIEQLARCLGWDGELNAVIGDPPKRVVQIKVVADEYQGRVSYKAQWMNPEDYKPEGGGLEGAATEDQRRDLSNRFGGLLRAAAAAAKKSEDKKSSATGPGKGKAKGKAKPPHDLLDDDDSDLDFPPDGA